MQFSCARRHPKLKQLVAFVVFAAISNHVSAQSRNRDTCDFLSWVRKGDVTFNNNVWNPGTDGQQCISIDSDGSSFNVTWQWARGDPSQPVHSFPYVRFNSAYLPGRLYDVSQLHVAGNWDMFPTEDASRDVEDSGTIANVAIDMFLDTDDGRSADATQASHEVMIWFATYGGGAPFGDATGIRHRVAVQPNQVAEFQLFDGTKADRPQRVLSWQAESPIQRFDIDVLSFLRTLVDNDILTRDLYVGLFELGTETFFSSENITFSASDFGMSLTSNATARPDGPGRGGWGGGRPSLGVVSSGVHWGVTLASLMFLLMLIRYL